MQHEPVYNTIIEDSQEYTEKPKSKKDRHQVMKTIRELGEKWEKVSTLSKERREKISKVLPVVFDHADNLKCVTEVIKTGEQTIKVAVPVAFDVEKGRNELKQIRVRFYDI